MKRTEVLFENKKQCCGCGVCSIVCPIQAIEMVADENGFIYPRIQEEKCNCCGLCKKTCAFQKQNECNISKVVYALSKKDKKSLLQSASGGAFAGIAENWIKEGGVVFGAALAFRNGKLTPCHMMAQTQEDLLPILGSKYVQSDVGRKFYEVKKLLETGRKVLFSGTPCQIAGLKSWLRKDYSELLTIDLVCHGVPNAKMFRDYIEIEEEKLGKSIEDFRFRDKENGWGLNAKIYYTTNGKRSTVLIPSNQSSFYELFLRGEIYRENCYNCPYANGRHPADLTVGDYWGIEIEHPEYLRPKGMLDQKDGISMLMVNTEKGEDVFEMYKDVFWYYSSSFEKASKHNDQLRHPSIPGANREKILILYQKKGYRSVDSWYWAKKRRENLGENVKYCLHKCIPSLVRNILKKMLRRE